MLKDKKYYPWMVVGMLVVVSLLNYLDRQMLATMRPFIMVDIKELESITNFGRLMAIFLWIYAIMSPISGMIADRLTRKWLIVISLFVWSTVTLMMGYVDDISHLYILRALMGVSEAFYIPAALSHSRLSPRENKVNRHWCTDLGDLSGTSYRWLRSNSSRTYFLAIYLSFFWYDRYYL